MHPSKNINVFLVGVLLLINPIPAGAQAPVLCGIDVLQAENFKSLDGAHVALITNHTGLSKSGKSTAEILLDADNVHLKAILSPEHGFRGTIEHGQEVGHGMDPETNLPVYSLYGKTKRPTDKMLKGVDTLVYDIQDVGTRFYTYITTMGMALEEAAKRNLRFVVLDRPNPIRGDVVEGDVLDAEVNRFTGYFEIPVRYGMTIGELAHWFNGERGLNANLHVVKMENWTPDMWFNQTGLKFIPPSPNIPDLTAALLYPGIGCFEATNVSVGRGTKKPFHLFGAPWINGKELASYLKQHNFPGVVFEKEKFKPKRDIYKGEKCEGVRIIVTDRTKARPFQIFVAAFSFLYNTYPDHFQPDWEEVRVVTGSHRLKEALENNLSPSTLLSQYDKTLADFKNKFSPYALY